MDVFQLAGLVAGISYPLIWRDIIRGKIRMNVATWLVWSVVNTVAVASIMASGFAWPWMNLVFAVGAVVTCLLSFGKGQWSWHTTETVCALFASFAMVLWWFFGPTWALIASVTAIFIGGIPQLRDTYRNPGNQSVLNWLLFFASSGLSVFGALQQNQLDLAHLLYPFIGLFFNGAMVYLIVAPTGYVIDTNE